MFVILSATNRPGANSLKLARLVEARLQATQTPSQVLSLQDLPAEVLDPAAVYGPKPASFTPFQQAILEAEGLIVIVPEYNGTFPGIAKYFIDMLKFPESLYELPVAFVGLSAGPWGGNRAVDQLTAVFAYRNASVFGRRLFLPGINGALSPEGQLTDPALNQRLLDLVDGFVPYARAVQAAKPARP